ncbi:MAG: hypothetical protein AAGG51_10985 [Cyanobacteria bacterium P01_G01_bin.54]
MTDRHRLSSIHFKPLGNDPARQTAMTIFGFFVFWFCLYLRGFPRPMVDDLFYVGSAINLSQTGDLLNPLLSAWSEPTSDRFFVYPPFHSYTLAAWLRVLGVGTRSLLLFQFTCYTVFSTFITLIFRKYKFSLASIIATVFVYAIFIGRMGLRPDALGLAYLIVGLWSLTSDRSDRYFWGFALLGASIFTAPILICYAAPLGLFLIIANFRKQANINFDYSLKRLAALLMAVVLNAFFLVWGVQFELQRFLADLSWHKSLRVAEPWQVLEVVGFTLSQGYAKIFYGSLYLTLIVLVIFLWMRWRQNKRSLLWLVAVLGISLILNFFIYSGTLATNFNFACSVVMVLILFNLRTSLLVRSGLCGLTLLTFCLYQSLGIVACLGQKDSDSVQYQETLLWFNDHPQYDYAIDEVVARFVFDYRIPDGITDWNYQNPVYFQPRSLTEKPTNTVWMVSTAKGAVTEGLSKDYERVQLWGRQFNSIPQRPYDVIRVK